MVGRRHARANDNGPAVLLQAGAVEDGEIEVLVAVPAASTTVMPLAVAATIAEKMSLQNCIATYLPFGPVACSSMRMTSPALRLAVALVIAPAALNTPLITAECTIAFAGG